MKRHLDPHLSEKLVELASMLPYENYVSTTRERIKGSDLLLTGVKEVEGKPIDKEKTYLIHNPLLQEKNHKRRLFRAYRKSGFEGVEKYLARYVAKDRRSVLDKVMEQLKALKPVTKKQIAMAKTSSN